MNLNQETLPALLCAIPVFNIYILIATLTTIPDPINYPLSIGALYILAQQLIVSLLGIRVFYAITKQPFRLKCRKTRVLLFLYGVFPLPILVVWFMGNIFPKMCYRRDSSCPRCP
ncbi:hypothetical protein BDV25DRAFT_135894 [Aspergillus avenaceus]|uniref:Uncharacterized protein n=1 Tax=Aspergillus avenaceus TaxID=36643 RepID=A0A5N6U7S1_ASPAV|nr:hypothetical protein BDV25DRAFT_135894 [Aspergillus avenaceus]